MQVFHVFVSKLQIGSEKFRYFNNNQLVTEHQQISKRSDRVAQETNPNHPGIVSSEA
jgi:hypothetical protein